MSTEQKLNISWAWYLIETWGGMMLEVKKSTTERGVDFYLPMTWRRTKVDGRDQPFATTRLPGNYAFVRLSSAKDEKGESIDAHLNEQASGLAQLRGMRRIYKNASGHYSRVPPDEIKELKVMEADEHRESGKPSPKKMEQRFKAGTKVRILRHEQGGFEGCIGEFLYSVRGQATVAVDNGIKVPVPELDLEEVRAQPTKMAS